MIEISENPDVPLYQRIVEAVCEAVAAGRLGPGQKLPTKAALAKELGVSVFTVGHSYELLQQRGIVRQRRGSGTYVQGDAPDRLHEAEGPRFHTIAVVVGEPTLTQVGQNWRTVITDIVGGVDDVLEHRAGRFQFVESFARASLSGLTEGSAVLLIRSKRTEPAVLEFLAQREIPVLQTWWHPSEVAVPCVNYELHHSPRLAVQHLIDCGYRRLGFVGHMGGEYALSGKFFAFTNTLYHAGLDFQLQHVRDVRNNQPGLAVGAALELAQRGDLPEALFVDTDVKAMEVMAVLQNAGLRVPEDIGVVGYDDIPEAAHCEPALTTVRPPRREIGRRAGQMLLDWACDRTPLQNVMLESELIVRDSTRRLEAAPVQQAVPVGSPSS